MSVLFERSKNVEYIVRHPEELRPVGGAKGIQINKRRMIPERTLIRAQRFSTDTMENRQILSFINTLFHHISERINELKDNLLESGVQVRTNWNS